MSVQVYLGMAGRDLAILVVGYAVLYGVGLARSLGAIKWLGLAYLVGWGTLGAIISYALMAGIGFQVEAVLGAAAVLVLAALVIGQLTPPIPAASSAAPATALQRAALAIGAAVILVAAVSAIVVAAQSTWTADSDTIALWVPHAQVLYYSHGLWDGGVYHPEYPPLISTMYAIGFGFVGGFHPSLLPLDQCLLGLSFVGAVLALLDRCVPRWLSFPSIALLMVAPEFFARLDSLLPDQTLAYFVASAALACVLWLRERRAAWLVVVVILSATGTLTKLEGETYALLLALIIVAGTLLRRRFTTALAALALFIGPAAIEPWRLWLGARGLPTSSTDYHLSSMLHPLYLAHRVGRIPYAADQILDVMFRPDRWLVVLPLALLAILAVCRRSPLLAVAATTWLLLAFAGLIAVYWAGQFSPFTLRDELQVSVDRVAATIVIVAGAIVPLILAATLEQADEASPGNSARRVVALGPSAAQTDPS